MWQKKPSNIWLNTLHNSKWKIWKKWLYMVLELRMCMPLTMITFFLHNLSCFKASHHNDNWLRCHRLWHAGMHTLKKSKHVWIPRLSMCKFEYDNLFDACAEGKKVCSSFKPKNSISTSTPLELLHIDLCGPIPIWSLWRSKYNLTIVDYYSVFTCLSFLNEKIWAFKEFLKM